MPEALLHIRARARSLLMLNTGYHRTTVHSPETGISSFSWVQKDEEGKRVLLALFR